MNSFSHRGEEKDLPRKKHIPRDTKVAVKSESVKRIIGTLEKKRLNIPLTFLYVLALGWIRVSLETLLGHQIANLYIYAHLMTFFLLMYLFGLLVIS
ncbi:MAG: hypothetical protein ACE5KV_07995, partial [Thermoplasmata archaeon]